MSFCFTSSQNNFKPSEIQACALGVYSNLCFYHFRTATRAKKKKKRITVKIQGRERDCNVSVTDVTLVL